MARFLIDVNLPYYFSVWRGPEYLHQRDLGDEWPDSEVWRFAKERALTIVSKDSDFSTRSMLQPPPPRVIHICLGNLRLRELHRAISDVWLEVRELSGRHRLVRVFADRIEAIE